MCCFCLQWIEDDEDDFLDLVSDRETGEQERHRRSTSRSPNPNSSVPPSAPSSIQQSQGRVTDDNLTIDDDMDMGPVHLSGEEASRTALPCSSANRDLVIRYATTGNSDNFYKGFNIYLHIINVKHLERCYNVNKIHSFIYSLWFIVKKFLTAAICWIANIFFYIKIVFKK